MDHVIDAKNKRLGRVATEIAGLLQGKNSPEYAPNKVTSDRVLLKNYKDITVSGKKFTDKMFYRHTGYMGHLKEMTFQQAWTKDPKKVVRETVRRMLPKNFLNQK
jgi:large subunit ribosomal protein L13